MQTVFETVYENQPTTVMETRYRQGYRTENYTVMRPVSETTQVARKYTVMKPVYQTSTVQRKYTVSGRSDQTTNTPTPVHRLQAGLPDSADGAEVHRDAAGLPDLVRSAEVPRSASRFTRPPTPSAGTRSAARSTRPPTPQRRYTVMRPVVQTSMVVAELHGLQAGHHRPSGRGGVRLLRAADGRRSPARSSSSRSVPRSTPVPQDRQAVRLPPPQEEAGVCDGLPPWPSRTPFASSASRSSSRGRWIRNVTETSLRL